MFLNSKSNTKCIKVTVKTQQQSINIGILLWQHVTFILEYLQTNIQRYEVQLVRNLVAHGDAREGK